LGVTHKRVFFVREWERKGSSFPFSGGGQECGGAQEIQNKNCIFVVKKKFPFVFPPQSVGVTIPLDKGVLWFKESNPPNNPIKVKKGPTKFFYHQGEVEEEVKWVPALQGCAGNQATLVGGVVSPR